MSEKEPKVGQTLGKYKLERLLGRGAMGSVFLATDGVLNRKVAVKTIAPAFSGDPVFKARFLREARTLAMLNHPHVVQIYDVFAELEDHPRRGDEPVPVPYLVTEFVDGHDLYSIVHRSGPLHWKRACLITKQTAMGLAAAAKRDIVHRDVKPGNILVAGDIAKVTDFGLAKPNLGDQNLTQAEVVMGTPDYMAPEQAMGQPIDWRADLYALGCTLYEMLTGGTPFGQGAPSVICGRHVHDPFPDIGQRLTNLPEPFKQLLDKMVAKDPRRRPTYEEVIKACEDMLDPPKEVEVTRGYVIVEVGRQHGLRTLIAERPIIVGRLPDCDISIDDARASRRHAVFQLGPEGYEVCDLGSRNGLVINGDKSTKATLKHGDRVNIGDTVLRFETHKQRRPQAVETGAHSTPFESGLNDNAPPPDFNDEFAFEPTITRNREPEKLTRIVAPQVAAMLSGQRGVSDPGLLRYRRVEVVLVQMQLLDATGLALQLDPGELAMIVNSHIEAMVHAVFKHSGSIETLTPNGITALFGTPVALPDRADRAVRAAMESMRALAQLAASWSAGHALRIRAGVAGGMVVAGVFGTADRRDYAAVGPVQDQVRTLTALAEPGRLLISGELVAALSRDITVERRDDLSARTQQEGLVVYQVLNMAQSSDNSVRAR